MSGSLQTQPFHFDKKFVVLSDWCDLQPSTYTKVTWKFQGWHDHNVRLQRLYAHTTLPEGTNLALSLLQTSRTTMGWEHLNGSRSTWIFSSLTRVEGREANRSSTSLILVLTPSDSPRDHNRDEVGDTHQPNGAWNPHPPNAALTPIVYPSRSRSW